MEFDLNIEIKEFWQQLAKIPKCESEGMKIEVKNNMWPIKKIDDDKETKQQQSKVQDLE